jgi:2-keto-4-pentenoate hydratase/2-oxohepta-3-ene-1,7-dioic acid hydratase in catechol pathway
MRLVSFQIPTPMGLQTRIGALDGQGRVVDLAAAYRLKLLSEGLAERAAARISAALLPGDMVGLIEGAERSLDAAQAAIDWAAHCGAESAAGGVAIVHEMRSLAMLPPVPRPPLLRDFMAFETHLKNIYPRLGREIPPEWYNLPVYYKGNPGSLATHGDDIPMPSYAEELDFEFELAFVIGKGGANVPREQAMAHVFGYTIYNDFSARAIQSREMSVGLGPAKGKDFRRGHVFGPWLVTADEIPDVYDLHMVARVNGEVWCDANSGTIHWRIADMIAHASLDEELRPGELIGSGTVGNGSGAERGQLLKRGDVVELEVDRIGVLRNRVV